MTAAPAAPVKPAPPTLDRLALVRDELVQLRDIIARVEQTTREATDENSP